MSSLKGGYSIGPTTIKTLNTDPSLKFMYVAQAVHDCFKEHSYINTILSSRCVIAKRV